MNLIQLTIVFGSRMFRSLFVMLLLIGLASIATAEPPPLAAHPANVWIKRTPLSDAPVSPRLG